MRFFTFERTVPAQPENERPNVPHRVAQCFRCIQQPVGLAEEVQRHVIVLSRHEPPRSPVLFQRDTRACNGAQHVRRQRDRDKQAHAAVPYLLWRSIGLSS
jgi:hypothetical protein